jgi:hypothetical protein
MNSTLKLCVKPNLTLCNTSASGWAKKCHGINFTRSLWPQGRLHDEIDVLETFASSESVLVVGHTWIETMKGLQIIAATNNASGLVVVATTLLASGTTEQGDVVDILVHANCLEDGGDAGIFTEE